MTQIDADIENLTQGFYLRDLRDLREEFLDDEFEQSRFAPGNLPEYCNSAFCAVDDLRVGIEARPGEPVDRRDGNAFEA